MLRGIIDVCSLINYWSIRKAQNYFSLRILVQFQAGTPSPFGSFFTDYLAHKIIITDQLIWNLFTLFKDQLMVETPSNPWMIRF